MFKWLFNRKPREIVCLNDDIPDAQLECIRLCMERGGAVFGDVVNGKFVENELSKIEVNEQQPTTTQASHNADMESNDGACQ